MQPHESSSHYLTANEANTLLFLIIGVLFVVGGGIDRIINYLFPNVFFCFGRQAAEFDRRQKIAYWIFGMVGFTIVSGIAVNWLYSQLFG